MSSIIRGVLPPLLILGVLGYALSWSEYPRKRNVLIGIGVIIALMILWRIKIGIVASRHALLLNIPLAISGAFFLTAERLPFIPARMMTFIRPVCILSIAAAFLLKNFNIGSNADADMLPSLYSAIKRDSAHRPEHFVIDAVKNAVRSSYYLGEKIHSAAPEGDSAEEIERFFNSLRFSNRVIYLIHEGRGNAPSVGLRREYPHGCGEVIFSGYRMRHHRKNFSVSRYSCRNALMVRKYQPAVIPDLKSVVFKEDFEKGVSVSKNSFADRLAARNHLCLWTNGTAPLNMDICPLGWLEKSFGEISRAAQDPIAGNWSLYLKSRSWASVMSRSSLPRGNYQASVLIRAVSDSSLRLGIRYKYGNTMINKQLAAAVLTPRDGIVEVILPITEAECPAAYFHLLILSEFGDFYIDDVCVRRAAKPSA